MNKVAIENRCPFCNSDNTHCISSPNWDDQQVTFEFVCSDCEEDFREVYNITFAGQINSISEDDFDIPAE